MAVDVKGTNDKLRRIRRPNILLAGADSVISCSPFLSDAPCTLFEARTHCEVISAPRGNPKFATLDTHTNTLHLLAEPQVMKHIFLCIEPAPAWVRGPRPIDIKRLGLILLRRCMSFSRPPIRFARFQSSGPRVVSSVECSRP